MSVNMIKEYIVLDIETSGLDVERDVILRIVAAKRDFERKSIVGKFNIWIKPTKPLSSKVKTLIGIDESVFNDATDMISAITAFNDFIGDLPIVSHNAEFAIKFLKNIYKKVLDKELVNKVFCTLEMAKKLAKKEQAYELKSYRLVDILRKYVNPDYQNQNASQGYMKEEAHITSLLFEKLVHLLEGK